MADGDVISILDDYDKSEEYSDANDAFTPAKKPKKRKPIIPFDKSTLGKSSIGFVLNDDTVRNIPVRALYRLAIKSQFQRVSKTAIEGLYALVQYYGVQLAKICGYYFDLKNTNSDLSIVVRPSKTITLGMVDQASSYLGYNRVLDVTKEDLPKAVRSKDKESITNSEIVIPRASFSKFFRGEIAEVLKQFGKVRIAEAALYAAQIAVEFRVGRDLLLLKVISSYYSESTLLGRHLDMLDGIITILEEGKFVNFANPEEEKEEKRSLRSIRKTADKVTRDKFLKANKEKAEKAKVKNPLSKTAEIRRPTAKPLTVTMPPQRPKAKPKKRGRPGTVTKKKRVNKKKQ